MCVPILVELWIWPSLLRHLDLLIHVFLRYVVSFIIRVVTIGFRHVFPEVLHRFVVVKQIVEIIGASRAAPVVGFSCRRHCWNLVWCLLGGLQVSSHAEADVERRVPHARDLGLPAVRPSRTFRERASHYHLTPDPVVEAFDGRATIVRSALLASTHEKAAYRIHLNALNTSATSAVYADNLVTGPSDPVLRFSPSATIACPHSANAFRWRTSQQQLLSHRFA